MKYKILSGKALQRYLKKHPKVALAAARAHSRILRLRVRVRHPRPKANLSHRALALAGHYVGTKEYPAGSNMTLFGRWFGMNRVPWCAIFVSYILSHVGRRFRESYVPHIVEVARAHEGGLSVIPASEVNKTLAAGFPVLTCFDWTHDGTADHVGFTVAVDAKAQVVHTIEGNTGDSNWSNGGEVLRETRALSLVQAFVKVTR